VEGEANEACIRFFARALRLPQACVVVLAGQKARRKLVRITGRSAEETLTALQKLAGLGQRVAQTGPSTKAWTQNKS